MMIYIQYFGRIREELQCDTEQIEWNGADTDALLAHLRNRGSVWQEVLAPERVFKLALNHQLLHQAQPIPDKAHIGILPPVTGG